MRRLIGRGNKKEVRGKRTVNVNKGGSPYSELDVSYRRVDSM